MSQNKKMGAEVNQAWNFKDYQLLCKLAFNPSITGGGGSIWPPPPVQNLLLFRNHCISWCTFAWLFLFKLINAMLLTKQLWQFLLKFGLLTPFFCRKYNNFLKLYHMICLKYNIKLNKDFWAKKSDAATFFTYFSICMPILTPIGPSAAKIRMEGGLKLTPRPVNMCTQTGQLK